MRMFKITLPLLDNEGKTLEYAHNHLKRVLLNEYGGFTSSEVVGRWKDENGEVFTDVSQRYEVAIEVGEDWVNLNIHSAFAVIDLIKWLLINTDQKAIFTEYDGFVNIQDAKTMGLVK